MDYVIRVNPIVPAYKYRNRIRRQKCYKTRRFKPAKTFQAELTETAREFMVRTAAS